MDALTSVWLIKRFQSGWEEAEVKFVPAGRALEDKPPDENPQVIHVDTGLGKFDHHQDRSRLPACARVLEALKEKEEKFLAGEVLERLVKVVVEVDLGNQIHWPESRTDRYEFSLDGAIGGLKKHGLPDSKLVEIGLVLLDGVYMALRCKIKAEKILKDGLVFETKWGKGLAFETENDMVLELGEKKGYSVVVRKDPQRGSVRIYARNDRGVDLTSVFEVLKEKDQEATWFLHQSKCLLLNGSSKNPAMRPTKLSLGKVVEILKEVKD